MNYWTNKLKSINPWHFLWVAVIISETVTLIVTYIQSYFWWGNVPYQVTVIGAVDALFAPLLIVPIIILFVSQISTLKQELKSRKESEQQIRFLAYYDSLTNLPNRLLFQELLEKAISFAERHNFMVGVLFIDLDYFKRINDTMGHSEGDKLLKSVTHRLINSIRSSDYITRWNEVDADITNVMSRLGGDEFILILQKLVHPLDAGKIAQRILKDMSEPFELEGKEVFITASIGISLYPSDGKDVDDLLKNADVAMYSAKSKGRNNYQYYSKSMTIDAEENLTLKNKLHRAMENNEFLVYYQPRQSIIEKRLVGLEALLRWKPNDAELINPSKFIALTEETGLIIPIGEWVIHTACLQNKIWQKAGMEPAVVSVNLSNRQFDQENLIEYISWALKDVDMDPQDLELEVTESALMQNPEEAIASLQKLKNMGIKISIDDFGTGYSSLNYLSKIPLDSLKIDRSFVMKIATSPRDQAIIKGIIALAHSMSLKVVAEGVETDEQLTFLQNCGCDEVQGFLLSQPLPAEEITRLFRVQPK